MIWLNPNASLAMTKDRIAVIAGIATKIAQPGRLCHTGIGELYYRWVVVQFDYYRNARSLTPTRKLKKTLAR